MYTMSGVTVAEGVSEGRAYILRSDSDTDVSDVVRCVSPSEEIVRYRQSSREFAKKLNNAMSGTVPDKVRDLFGAVSSYITNADNTKAIEQRILAGAKASAAAQEVLLKKIENFSHACTDSSLSLCQSDDSLRLEDEDEEMAVTAQELSSLMREFIGTINSDSHLNKDVPQLHEGSVVIASDLTPARFLSLHTELVRAVILEGGKSSGHLSTVLRDLRIPAVFEVKGALTIKNGEHVLVDATRGSILVEPPRDTARALIAQQDYFADFDDAEDATEDVDCRVTVAGSMGAVSDAAKMSKHMVHGLGLLRSEFLFLNYQHEPSCEEMTKTFEQIFSKIPKTAPLTARTFDFAGDKNPLFTVELDESGALRKYGAQVGSNLLRNQLKALLLAAQDRDINIVFPLITRISEARTLTSLLEGVVQELKDSGQSYGTPHCALMIETPAAVLSARAFASFGEMFIIGTSSLAEYAAAPRPPEEYFTPALSKMIAIACKAAHDEGVRVGIAGRFARRPELLPFYLGLGVDYITTDASAIAKLRKSLQYLEDRGIEPHFDSQLYSSVMDIASAHDLQRLLYQDDFI